MRRHQDGQSLYADTPERVDYDGGWLGVDMLSGADRVAADKVSFARNLRWRGGDAAPRLGIREMEWATVAHVAGGAVYDAIAFSSIDGYEWLLRATADGVIISRPEAESVIALPAGVTLDADAFMVQAFAHVYLFRGEQADPLRWVPGSDPADPASNAFAAVPDAAVPGYFGMSRSGLALWRHNRLWVAHDRDTVTPSDINAPTEFNPANDLFVERGAHDGLVGMYPFGDDIIFFKSESVFLATGVSGSLDATVVRELTREVGAKGMHAITAMGKDVWFLSDAGVLSLGQVLDNQLQGEAAAKSRDIQPLIEAVNWQAARGIVSAFWDGKYYLALPVNGSGVNNVVAVFDTLTGAWAGFDECERLRVLRLVKLQYQGKQRLFVVAPDGKVYLYEDGYADRWDGEDAMISTAMLTRGYLCGDDGQKVFQEAHLALKTQMPQLRVSVVVNGSLG